MTDVGPTPSDRPTPSDTTTRVPAGTSQGEVSTGTSQGEAPTGTSTSAPPARSSAGRSGKQSLGHTRTSGIWAAVVALVILLVLLAIFVLQNVQEVEVSYFGWQGRAPLASALLIATAAGALIAVVAGALRILQLRRRVRQAQRH